MEHSISLWILFRAKIFNIWIEILMVMNFQYKFGHVIKLLNLKKTLYESITLTLNKWNMVFPMNRQEFFNFLILLDLKPVSALPNKILSYENHKVYYIWIFLSFLFLISSARSMIPPTNSSVQSGNFRITPCETHCFNLFLEVALDLSCFLFFSLEESI